MNIELIGLSALEAAYNKQIELSEKGTIGKKVSRGAGGDYSLRGDIESEEAVINILRKNNFPAIVYAEEHGIVKLVDNPTHIVVIDGFDGSSGLAKNPKARGGTMLAIYPNLNPKYKDAIFSGITDFSIGKIVFGKKDYGVVLSKYGKFTTFQKLPKLPEKEFDENIKMHFDDPKYWGKYMKGITAGVDEIARVTRECFTNKLEGKVKSSGLVSSGAMCVDLLLGKVDAVGGVSAKGVFEQPTEYLLLKELGGIIVNYKGEDIGDNYWLEDREQHKQQAVPSLRASSHLLAMEIIEYLNR